MRRSLIPILFGSPPWLPKANGVGASVYADFANGRYWTGRRQADSSSWLSALGGTFTRASTATYTNSSGLLATASSGALRFDYTQAGAAKGILLEGARTNVVTFSQAFDNAAWTSGALLAVGADAAVAPDGTTTADKLIPDTTNSTVHRIFQSGVTASQQTFSVFVKYAGYPWAKVRCGNSYSNINTQTGALGNSSATTSTATSLGNGWFRVTTTFTNVGADFVMIYPMTTDNAGADAATFTGDGSSGIYAWGGQLELGAFASSYIPTTSASVTRAADSLSLATNPWWNNTNGTIYSSNIVNGIGGNQQFVDTTGIGNPGIYVTSAGLLTSTLSSVANLAQVSPAVTAGVRFKQASALKVGDYATYSTQGSGTSANATAWSGSIATMYLGSNSGGSNNYFGTLGEFGYWPSRAPGSELQRLIQ